MNNGKAGDNPAIKLHGRGPRGTRCSHCNHIARGPAKYGKQSVCTAPEMSGGQVYRFWFTCGLYSGADAQVEITCPACLRKRKILRTTLASPNHKELCSVCAQAAARPEKDKANGSASEPAKKAANLPVFDGCSPKPARKGRCEGLLTCPGYPDCLTWAKDHNWNGFREERR